jgi:hypothetical protein
MKQLALALLLTVGSCAADAAVIEGVRLKRVIAGNVLLAEATLAGRPTLLAIRLLYVRAPEPIRGDDPGACRKAVEIMTTWASPDRTYTAWAPGDSFSYDTAGRLLAVVWPAATIKDVTEASVSLEDNLLASGFGCLTDETGPIADDFGLHGELADTMRIAMQARFGLWSEPPAWWPAK